MVVSSGQYEVIETGNAITFDENADIVIKIKASWNFEFTIAIEFKEDGGERSISTTVDEQEKTIKYICTNFEMGAGTAEPLEVGNAGTKKLYLHFWVEKISASRYIRSIQYTVYKER